MIKNVMEHEGNSDTNCNWCTWNGLHMFREGAGRVEIVIEYKTEAILTPTFLRSARMLTRDQ